MGLLLTLLSKVNQASLQCQKYDANENIVQIVKRYENLENLIVERINTK